MTFEQVMERCEIAAREVDRIRDESDGRVTFELIEAENNLFRLEKTLDAIEIRSLRHSQLQDAERMVEQDRHINRLTTNLAESREECLRIRHALRLERESHGKAYKPSSQELKCAGKVRPSLKYHAKDSQFIL